MSNDKRYAVLCNTNKKVEFKDLKKGDVFKLYEPNDIRVKGKDKAKVTFKATSNPYLNKYGAYELECETSTKLDWSI